MSHCSITIPCDATYAGRRGAVYRQLIGLSDAGRVLDGLPWTAPVLSRDFFGLPIPDAGPVFAVTLALHIAAGLTAVVAGALAATARKRSGRHPKAGRVYLVSLSFIFATASVMSAIRWR